MAHATAWDSANPGYRNHYCTHPTTDSFPICQELVGEGFMRVVAVEEHRPERQAMHTFAVMEAGFQALVDYDARFLTRTSLSLDEAARVLFGASKSA